MAEDQHKDHLRIWPMLEDDPECEKLLGPPPAWLQRELIAAEIVSSLRRIKDALWYIGLMLGFITIAIFFG